MKKEMSSRARNCITKAGYSEIEARKMAENASNGSYSDLIKLLILPGMGKKTIKELGYTEPKRRRVKTQAEINSIERLKRLGYKVIAPNGVE